MFRITGVICVLCGCLGVGYHMVMREKQRIVHLRELCRIIRRMQAEMRYGKRTISEICEILSECGEEDYRKCFGQIRGKMLLRKGDAMEKLWEQETRQCLDTAPLREDEKSILIRLPECLGMQDAGMQADSMQQFLELLERRLVHAQEEYDGKAKVIWSISTLSGVLITVVLL